MISKYYLSSHNPEAQKPFCMVRMEWLPDHDLISGNGPQFTSTVTKVAEECRVLPTHNQQLWQQYSKRESGMINQQWKQQRTSSGKPWIPERPRTLRFSSIATPKEWSQALYNRTSQTDWERLTKRQVQQSRYCNQSTRDLPTLAEGDVVRVKPFQRGTKVWKKSLITSWLAERSYVVKTPDGETYRRNRYH